MNKTSLKSELGMIKYLIVLAFIPFQYLPAQPTGLDPASPFKNYEVRSFTSVGDISPDGVFDFDQDSQGYLWIATKRGLWRFDGTQIEIYNLKNVPGLKTETIRFVCIDSKDLIWFATRRGLFYMKDGVVTEFLFDDGSRIRQIWHMELDSADRLWLSTDVKEVFYVEDFELKKFPLDYNVYKAFSGGNNTVWIPERKGKKIKMHQYDVDTKTSRNSFEISSIGGIESFVHNQQGDVLLGMVDGRLIRYQDGMVTDISPEGYQSKDRIRGIIWGNDGAIWYTSYGLHRIYQGEHAVFERQDGLTNGKTNNLFRDKDGSIWVGTKYGFNQFINSPFERYNLPQEFISKGGEGYHFIEDLDKTIWLGTRTNGLYFLKENQFKKVTGLDLIGEQINDISRTKAGNIWVASSKGIFLVNMDRGSFTIIDQPLKRPANFVYELETGEICFDWIEKGARQILVLKSSNGEEKKIFDKELVINFLHESKDGRFWIGTRKGLYCYESDSIRLFDLGPEYRNKYMSSICDGRDSSIWVGTLGSGLLHIHGNNYQLYNTFNGLPVNQALLLLPSSNRGFWFFTGKGENGLLQQLAQAGTEEKPTLRIVRSYHLRGKGEAQSTLSNPKFAVGWNHSVLFHGENEVIKFSPEKIYAPIPRLQIENVLMNGVEVPLSGISSFQAASKDFEFHYSTIDFINGAQQQFEYKLEGYDSDWHDAGTRRVAYYSSLPAGDFTFKVRLSASDEEFVEAVNPFSFKKEEYWWKTVWAILVYILLIITVIVIIFQLRIRAIKRQKRALQIKVEERTSELRELTKTLEQKVVERTREITVINEELTESDERYRLALEASSDGIFDWDVRNDVIKFSPAIYTMLGYEPYAFKESRAEIYKRIPSGRPEKLSHPISRASEQ